MTKVVQRRKEIQKILRIKDSIKEAILHTTFGIRHRKRKLTFSNGEKLRIVTIDAKNVDQLQEQKEKDRKRFGFKALIRVVNCYEADRNGFWLNRYLLRCGIDNAVFDSTSIEVNCRKRLAKTDRIDTR